MKFYEILFVFFFFLCFGIEAEGQQIRENEIIVIHGEKFVIHQVRTGETIYSIEKRFKVDSLELVFHNPQISEGLKIGEIIKIPYKDQADIKDQPPIKKGDPSGFQFYTITSRKETPYFIAKKYGVTVEELYAYNPEVRKFRRGTKLRIPLWETQERDSNNQVISTGKIPGTKEKTDLVKHTVTSGETLFSLSRRYDVSVSEILFYNPGARDLKAGSVLYFPREKGESATKNGTGTRKTDPDAARPYKPSPPESVASYTGTMGNYFQHTIVSGETLWGIAHKYDVSEEELTALNPVLEEEFPAGVTINIPLTDSQPPMVKPVNDDAFIKHQVKAGETLFGLSSKYALTIPAIKKFNPVLEKRNLVSGETILIPRKPDREIVDFIEKITDDSVTTVVPGFESDYYKVEMPQEIPDNCHASNYEFFSRRVYNVALFLPLFTIANDTINRQEIVAGIVSDSTDNDEVIELNDTIIEQEEPREIFHGFYQDSENFLHFYEGVLLAVDSLQRTGMRIRLNVYDTQRNIDFVRKYIYDTDFLQTDLIIGPVYPSVQKEVATIAAKNRIPMISPLSSNSNELTGNKYYYQVNPDRDFIAFQTAELIAEEYFNSNFIVFNIGKNNNPVTQKVPGIVREKLFNSGYWGKPGGFTYNIYEFENEGPFGFSRILSKEKENVVFIPSLDEGDISIALSNIDNLSDDYSITLVGFNWYQKYKSIDVENFHNLKLHYIAPYWIDFDDPATIRFIEKFKEHFYTEPDNFGMQGYDVAFYFLNAIRNFGSDFNQCLPYMTTDLVQGDYRFEKVSKFGGYMNKGVSLISYERDYDVVRERVIGRYNIVQK